MNLEQEFASTSGRIDEKQSLEAFDAPDLSAQDLATHTANMTANAFQATNLFQIVEVKAGPGQVSLMGRVKKDKERAFVEMVVHPTLVAMEEGPCDGFIGKQFLLVNGALRYGWVVSFTAKDIREAANRICGAFVDIIPRQEVMEAPLIGGSSPQSGGLKTGRKGAHAIS